MWIALLLTASLVSEVEAPAGDGAGLARSDRTDQQRERPGRQERAGGPSRRDADEQPFARAEGPRIAWYPSLAQARAEAERTGKPILLQSAAPQCHGVPGIW